MTYFEKIKVNKNELKYYNELLQLDLEEDAPFYNKDDIERLGAKQDDYIGIYTITFDNENYITIDLASGSCNYYDNIVLWDKDGHELMCADCNYTIDSFELFYDEDIYEVRLEVE